MLSSVGGDLALGAWGIAATIPAYLVIAVVLYSALVMTAMLVLARDLAQVWEENKRTEAELRSTGSHLREKGEGTAMPDGRRDGRAVMRQALAPGAATLGRSVPPVDAHDAECPTAAPCCRRSWACCSARRNILPAS